MSLGYYVTKYMDVYDPQYGIGKIEECLSDGYFLVKFNDYHLNIMYQPNGFNYTFDTYKEENRLRIDPKLDIRINSSLKQNSLIKKLEKIKLKIYKKYADKIRKMNEEEYNNYILLIKNKYIPIIKQEYLD